MQTTLLRLGDYYYDIENLVDLKEYLSVELIDLELKGDIKERILRAGNKKIFGIPIEELEDMNKTHLLEDLDNLAPSTTKLLEDDSNLVHAIIDPNLPHSAYNLKNPYIPEDQLAKGVGIDKEGRVYLLSDFDEEEDATFLATLDKQGGKFEVETFNPSTKKKVKEKYTRQRTDIPAYVVALEDTTRRTIRIDYDTLLKDGLEEELEAAGMEGMFNHHIDQKVFQGITDKIVNDYNYVLNEYPELSVKVFKFRTRVATEGKKYDIYNFFFDCIELVNDNKLRSIVKAMNDTTYTLNLDKEAAGNASSVVEDLKVTDSMNQVLLQAAILQRIFTPIINEYAVFMSSAYGLDHVGKRYLINHLNTTIFTYILRYISLENGVNVLNKLYKIIEPRVKATNYSDKVIWGVYRNYGMDDDVAINRYINKVIRTIIPKLDANKSSISFLDVVVSNMLKSDFRQQFSYSHKEISINTDDDDDLNELDKIALTKFHRNNEMDDLIVATTINQYIKENEEEYGITPEMVKITSKYLSNLNEFQISLIKLYYDSRFPTLESCTEQQLISLILILRGKMQKSRLYTLADLLISRRIDTTPSKSGRVPTDIIQSADYMRIRDNYKNIITKFDKDSYILKLSSVYSFDFEVYDPCMDETHTIYKSEMDRKEIASELFQYVINCLNL